MREQVEIGPSARIILARPDRVGDAIISTSCIAPLKRRFPAGKIWFMAAERMRPLLEGHHRLAGFIPCGANLGVLHADAFVGLHPDENCFRSAFEAGIRVRIGYATGKWDRLQTHTIGDRRKEGRKHEAEYNLELLEFLGVERPPDLRCSVHLPERSLRSLQRKVPWALEKTPFGVINVTAHSPVARWPARNFAAVAERLRRDRSLVIVLIGDDADDPSVKQFREATRDFCDLAGRTDLGELGWLLKHAQVLVTRNSGPSHLAAAVGCPVVDLFARPGAIYGPTRWRPLSEKAVVIERFLKRRPLEPRNRWWKRCFDAVSVDEIVQAVSRALDFRD